MKQILKQKSEIENGFLRGDLTSLHLSGRIQIPPQHKMTYEIPLLFLASNQENLATTIRKTS
jgi:hypothetical protein